MKKITVVGSGYVGMANAVMLAAKHDVTILDIDKERVDLVNNKKSTVGDSCIQDYLDTETLTLRATTDSETAYTDAEWIQIETYTGYNQIVLYLSHPCTCMLYYIQ